MFATYLTSYIILIIKHTNFDCVVMTLSITPIQWNLELGFALDLCVIFLFTTDCENKADKA